MVNILKLVVNTLASHTPRGLAVTEDVQCLVGRIRGMPRRCEGAPCSIPSRTTCSNSVPRVRLPAWKGVWPEGLPTGQHTQTNYLQQRITYRAVYPDELPTGQYTQTSTRASQKPGLIGKVTTSATYLYVRERRLQGRRLGDIRRGC